MTTKSKTTVKTYEFSATILVRYTKRRPGTGKAKFPTKQVIRSWLSKSLVPSPEFEIPGRALFRDKDGHFWTTDVESCVVVKK